MRALESRWSRWNNILNLSSHLNKYTFHLKQLKSKQNIWDNSTQDVEHQVIKDNDPWKMGNKWEESYYCLVLLPRESFQVLKHVKGM